MSHSMMVTANPLSNNLMTKNLGTGASKLKAAVGTTGSTTGTNPTSTGSSSTDSIGSTFLSLLVQELQNQDPTAPMDSTQMVGQMISLNQLDQLTSINQTLSNAYPGTTSSSSNASGAGASGGTSGGASSQAVTSAATAAAMRLLASRGAAAQPGVSTSVSLPAF